MKKGRKRKLTKEQELKFLDWWLSRSSLKEWAYKFGVSRQCLRDVLIRYAIVKPQTTEIGRIKMYGTEKYANQRAD